jgi:hypothetical protein
LGDCVWFGVGNGGMLWVLVCCIGDRGLNWSGSGRWFEFEFLPFAFEFAFALEFEFLVLA